MMPKGRATGRRRRRHARRAMPSSPLKPRRHMYQDGCDAVADGALR